MKITLNGKSQTLEKIQPILAFLQNNGFDGKLVAVAMNGEFVPKSSYANTQINDGDQIEIVAPMQGG